MEKIKIRAFFCLKNELAVDDRGLARDACQHLRKARQAFGPVVTAPPAEPHPVGVPDDLEAIPGELRLMQPGVALRGGLGGGGDAGTDELRGHSKDVSATMARRYSKDASFDASMLLQDDR
jgi:hypothetical protein